MSLAPQGEPAPVDGWYQDPLVPGQRRLWSQGAWTERITARPLPQLHQRPLPASFPALGSFIRGGLVFSVLISLVEFGGDVWTVGVLDRWLADLESVTVGEGEQVDALTMVTSIAWIFVVVVVGLATLRWIFVAMKSDRIDPARLSFSPGWAAVVWFIPIANLWMPYQVVSELDREAQVGPDRDRPAPRAALVIAWWSAYLAMIVWRTMANNHAGTLERLEGVEFIRALRVNTLNDLGIAAVQIVAAVLFWLVVRRITRGLTAPSREP